jgi:transposase InsO family protein
MRGYLWLTSVAFTDPNWPTTTRTGMQFQRWYAPDDPLDRQIRELCANFACVIVERKQHLVAGNARLGYEILPASMGPRDRLANPPPGNHQDLFRYEGDDSENDDADGRSKSKRNNSIRAFRERWRAYALQPFPLADDVWSRFARRSAFPEFDRAGAPTSWLLTEREPPQKRVVPRELLPHLAWGLLRDPTKSWGAMKIYRYLNDQYAGVVRSVVFEAVQRTEVSEMFRQPHASEKDRKRRPTRKPILMRMPNDMWQIDTITLDTKGESGRKSVTFFRDKEGKQIPGIKPPHVLTIIDHFSKYAWAVPMRREDANGAVDALIYALQDAHTKFSDKERMDPELGVERAQIPRVMQSDNGMNFIGQEYRAWLMAHGILPKYSQPHHPNTQGAVERLNRTIKDSERKWTSQFKDKGFDLSVLVKVLEGYNNTYHSSLGVDGNKKSITPYRAFTEPALWPLIRARQSKRAGGMLRREARLEKRRVCEKKGDALECGAKRQSYLSKRLKVGDIVRIAVRSQRSTERGEMKRSYKYPYVWSYTRYKIVRIKKEPRSKELSAWIKKELASIPSDRRRKEVEKVLLTWLYRVVPLHVTGHDDKSPNAPASVKGTRLVQQGPSRTPSSPSLPNRAQRVRRPTVRGAAYQASRNSLGATRTTAQAQPAPTQGAPRRSGRTRTLTQRGQAFQNSLQGNALLTATATLKAMAAEEDLWLRREQLLKVYPRRTHSSIHRVHESKRYHPRVQIN